MDPTSQPGVTMPLEEEMLYSALESYPWHTDAEFQSGLRAILGQPATTPTTQLTPTTTPRKSPNIQSSPSGTEEQSQSAIHSPAAGAPLPPANESKQLQPDVVQTEDLTLRARCFYFARQNPTTTPDFTSYKLWRARQPPEKLSNLSPVAGSDLPVPPLSDSEPSSTDVTPQKAERRRHSVLTGHDAVISTSFDPTASTANDPQLDSSTPAEPTATATAAATQPEQQQETGEMQPTTMAEIMELIRTGQPIPGIKDIPDTVLTGQGTDAAKSKRRKPWETAADKVNPNYEEVATPIEVPSVENVDNPSDLARLYFGTRTTRPDDDTEALFGNSPPASSVSGLFVAGGRST